MPGFFYSKDHFFFPAFRHKTVRQNFVLQHTFQLLSLVEIFAEEHIFHRAVFVPERHKEAKCSQLNSRKNKGLHKFDLILRCL